MTDVVIPKTPEEAILLGWKRWSPNGSDQTEFPLYASDGNVVGSWISFVNVIHVNFEVPK